MTNKGLKKAYRIYHEQKPWYYFKKLFFFKMILKAIKPLKMVQISSFSGVILEIYSWTSLQIFISPKRETDKMIKRKNDTQVTRFISKFGYCVSKYALYGNMFINLKII